MTGLLDLLTGGSTNPATAAFLSADRGLLNRLGAYMQAKQAAPVMAQRKQILQEAYTPAQDERTEYGFEAPQAPPNDPADPLGNGFGSALGLRAPEQLRTTKIEARPAAYDVDTAVARLRSIGDLDTADTLLNGEYKQAMAGSRTAGKGEKWYANRQLVKGSDGKMYNQIQSDQGNAKLVPVDGDLSGELKQMDLGGRKSWVNAYTGQPVSGFDVSPTAYQSWQMDDDAQAGQAMAVESSKVTGRLGAEKAADYSDKGDKASEAIAELDSLTGALGKLSSPAYTKYQNVAGFFGGGDADYQAALGEVDRASGRMLAYVERLPGAATDADRDIFMASAGVLRNPNLSIAQRIAAADAAKASFQRLVQKYGNGAPVIAPRPAAAPKAAAGGSVTVRAPNGKVYIFPDQKAANNFKLKAGIR